MPSPNGSRSEVPDPSQRLKRLERLWAPHRLAYITADLTQGDPDGTGCPFCAGKLVIPADSLARKLPAL